MDTWTRIPILIRFAVLITALLVTITGARALEPGWYAPDDDSGQGIIVRCNDSDECAILWAAYRPQRLERFAPETSELITVVETSTAVTEAVNSSELIAALGDIRGLRVSPQAWFISVENCARAEPVCVVALAATRGEWFGRSFEFEDPSIIVTLTQAGDTLTVDFDARLLFPERCDIGIGGLLLRDCIGVKEFRLLAR